MYPKSGNERIGGLRISIILMLGVTAGLLPARTVRSHRVSLHADGRSVTRDV